MEKRLTLNDWNYIGKGNIAQEWLKPFCTYHLVKIESGFKREVRLNLPMYLLVFIPIHLVKIIWCLWDGGLKEFTFERRVLRTDWLEEHGENWGVYPKAKEIWEKA